MGERLLRERVLFHEPDDQGRPIGNPVWVERDEPVPADLELDESSLERLTYDPDDFYRNGEGQLVPFDMDDPAPADGDPSGPAEDPFPDGGGVAEIEEWVRRAEAMDDSTGRRAQHALDLELAKGDGARSTLVASLRKTLGLS